MPKPDFFIVGAPKSGTTAMCNYLAQHPEIYMSPIKEPHFFGSDLNRVRFTNELEAYLQLFEQGNGKICGEGSVWYLSSEKAAYEIYTFNPTAKIIIMLRNPVDLLYSLHNHVVFNAREDITDFEEALKAEPERKKGQRIPRTCPAPHVLLYSEAVQFTKQIRRYLDVFPSDSVEIILYDDFKQDTIGVYRNTLFFLGVETQFKPEITIINPSKKVRSKTLRSFIRFSFKHFRALFRPLFPSLDSRVKVGQFLINLNTIPQERSPMDQALRRRLVEQFAPEVDQLSLLLKRDLSHWKTV